MDWSNSADGAILRNLRNQNFDFSKVWEIDFNIDFNSWPLSTETQEAIKTIYPNSEFIDPDDEDIEDGNLIGYVQLKTQSKLTYDFVIEMQRDITEKMKPFGGWCESWGVMH